MVKVRPKSFPPSVSLWEMANANQRFQNRYSLFTILYPIGISSEWWLMYKVTNVTTNMALAGTFYFCLGLYVPGK